MSDLRKHVYTFILYPDSCASDWKDYLDSLMIPILVSPLHDLDVLPSGEKKKPHYHVLLDFGQAKKSWEQVQEYISPIGGVLAPVRSNGSCDSWVANKRTCARYFCHLDSPDKVQYNPDDVLCFGGFDFWAIANSTSNKYATIKAIISFCRDQGIYDYADLMDYCIEYNDMWYMTLCDGGTYVIKEYMKSKTWRSGQKS